jgi:hypothetical protein
VTVGVGVVVVDSGVGDGVTDVVGGSGVGDGAGDVGSGVGVGSGAAMFVEAGVSAGVCIGAGVVIVVAGIDTWTSGGGGSFGSEFPAHPASKIRKSNNIRKKRLYI